MHNTVHPSTINGYGIYILVKISFYMQLLSLLKKFAKRLIFIIYTLNTDNILIHVNYKKDVQTKGNAIWIIKKSTWNAQKNSQKLIRVLKKKPQDFLYHTFRSSPYSRCRLVLMRVCQKKGSFKSGQMTGRRLQKKVKSKHLRV